jgi:hypothetical protein
MLSFSEINNLIELLHKFKEMIKMNDKLKLKLMSSSVDFNDKDEPIITITNEETNTNLVFKPDSKTGTCELCGSENEDLRPYGPNDEYICYSCGMKNINSTTEKLNKALEERMINEATGVPIGAVIPIH